MYAESVCRFRRLRYEYYPHFVPEHVPSQRLVDAIARHIRHHVDTLNIQIYEVVTDPDSLPLLLSNAYIRDKVGSGLVFFLRTRLKPIGQLPHSPYCWQGLHENIAVLRWWGTSSRVFFIDADEYVVSRNVPIDNTTADLPVVASITRLAFSCTACGKSRNPLDVPFSKESWAFSFLEREPKLVIDPSAASCLYVHWAEPESVPVDETKLVILHQGQLLKYRDESAHGDKYSRHNLPEFDWVFNQSIDCTAHSPFKPLFHLVWTTPPSTLQPWRLRVLQSIYDHHKHIESLEIRIYTNTLGKHDLISLSTTMDIKVINILPFDEDFFSGSPVEAFISSHRNLVEMNHSAAGFEHSHLTDVIRPLLLWRYGGVYLDFDVIVLQSLENFRNSFAAQYSDVLPGEPENRYNFAVAVFDEKHPFISDMLNNISRSYNPKKWTCIGPALTTAVANDWESRKKLVWHDGAPVYPLASDPQSVNAFDSSVFYPVPWTAANVTVKASHIGSAAQMVENAATLHIWTHVLREVDVEAGSLLDMLLHSNAVNNSRPRLPACPPARQV